MLFSDIVGSTKLKQILGDREAVAAIQRHDALFRATLSLFPESEEIVSAGDAFLVVFAKPSDAVRFALLLQKEFRDLARQTGHPVLDRIGIHVGEVWIDENAASRQQKELSGIQVDTAARIAALGSSDQILMGRFAFDSARQALKGEDLTGLEPLLWLNHGPFVMKGIDEPLEVCEVGEEGKAALTVPRDSDKAHRFTYSGNEPVLGWRPAIGQTVPGTSWVLEEKLGEGGFGEVWLGRDKILKSQHVFKFCFRADRVRSLKREVTLFRLLRERIGQHPNIVSIEATYFDEAPFYIVMEYVDGRELKAWCEARGGMANVSLPMRLEIVAQAADALQAAHDSGIIHRDVKPSNILVGGSSEVQVHLTDFGIGQIVSEEALAGITRFGFTQTVLESSSRSGTHLYMAPELLAGNPASIRSDIYALGVVLYQLIEGDFAQPVTADWTRRIADPLLREDLEKCFAGDPRERFASAAQLAAQLRSLEERRSELAHRQRQEAALREQQANRERLLRTRRLVAISGAIAVFAIVALVVTGLALGRARRAEQAAKTETQKTGLARAEAEQQRDQNRAVAAQASYDLARIHFDQISGGYPTGLAHLARALRSQPTHSPTIQALFHVLPEKSWCVPVSPPLPHPAAVDKVLYSADGKRVATLAGARLRVWDVAKQITIFGPIENFGVQELAGRMSRDGRKLLSNKNGSGLFQLWDIETKQAIGAPFRTRAGSIDNLPVFSPDGSSVLFADEGLDESRSQTRTLRLLDTRTGENRAVRPSAVLSDVHEAAATPDGVSWLIFGRTTQRVQQADGSQVGRDLPCLLTVAADGSEKAFASIESENSFFSLRNALLFPQWEGALIRNDRFSDQTLSWANARTGVLTPLTISERIPTDRENTYTLRTLPNTEGIAALPPAIQSLAALVGTSYGSGRGSNENPPVSISDRGAVAVWDPQLSIQSNPGDPKTRVRGPRSVGYDVQAEFIADDRLLVFSEGQRYRPTLKIFATATAEAITPEITCSGDLHSAAVGPDGKFLATGHGNKTARIWQMHHGAKQKRASNPTSPTQTKPASAPTGRSIVFTTFSRDGTRFCLAYDDKSSQVFDTLTNQPVGPSIQHSSDVRMAEISGDGKRVLIAISPRGQKQEVASGECSARVWDIANGQALGEPLKHANSVRAARFDSTCQRVVTASKDKTARVWDAATGQPLTQPLEHEADLLDALFSPDGLLVATVAADNTARIWNAPTGEPMMDPLRHAEYTALNSPGDSLFPNAPSTQSISMRSASFDAEGKVLLSSGSGAVLWEIANGRSVYSVLQDAGVHSAFFSPAGNRILTTSDDGVAMLWSRRRGGEFSSWTKSALEHGGFVSRVGFTADGSLAVTVSKEGTVRIWDAEAALPVFAPDHRGTCRAVEVLPDKKRIAIIDESGRATVHEVSEKADEAPAWFPDFVEAIAAQRIRKDGTMEATPQTPLEVLAAVRQSDERSRYRQLAEWLLDFTLSRAASFEEETY